MKTLLPLLLLVAAPLRAEEDAAKASLPGVAPAAACLVSGPAADAKGCAAAYKPVAEAYLEAYKAMDAWIGQASSQVAAAAEKAAGLEKSIRDNESQMTGLKLERSKESKAKLKELEKANKGLWKELDAARAEQDSVCRSFAKAASARVKELSAEVSKRLPR